MKRSARLKSKPRATGVSESDAEEPNYDSEEAPPVKKTRVRKRKADEEDGDTISTHPQAKRVKGKRGILKELVEMPMDVLFEIFGQLEPLDLLNLSRTTKALRAILMSKSSVSIWKQSSGNIAGLPQCPDDLSEPQWADLVFGKTCYFCQRNLASNHTCWAARIRTCSRCMETHFIEKKYPQWSYTTSGYHSELAQYVPTLEISKTGGRYPRHKTYAYLATNQMWKEEYQSLDEKDKEAWANAKVEEEKRKREHSKACIVWAERQQELRYMQKVSIIDDRKAIVVEYIKSMGWADELAKIPVGHAKPQDEHVVVKACQKEVTEKVLNGLEEFLDACMKDKKAKRLLQERKQFLKDRLSSMKKIYNEYLSTLPADVFYPNTADLIQDEEILAVIDNSTTPDLTNEQLDVLTAMFPEAIQRRLVLIECKLLELITSSPLDKSFIFDPKTVLDLASTFFYCSDCSSYVTKKQAIQHYCGRRAFMYKPLESEAEIVMDAINEAAWNTYRCIKFQSDAWVPLGKAFESCGFDPQKTTAKYMEELDPIFECLHCNVPREGRCTMKWDAVCSHVKKSYHPEKCLIVLHGEEEVSVRARMLEQQEQYYFNNHISCSLCVHCRMKESPVKLLQHVEE